MPYVLHDDDSIHYDEKVERVFHITDPRIPHDWIEKAAYFNWERNGRPHGNHWADWLAAENDLRETIRSTPKPPASDQTVPPKEEDPKHSWLA
jgi:hypothetical protein